MGLLLLRINKNMSIIRGVFKTWYASQTEASANLLVCSRKEHNDGYIQTHMSKITPVGYDAFNLNIHPVCVVVMVLL